MNTTNPKFKDKFNPMGGYCRVAACGCTLHIDPSYNISSREYKECGDKDCTITKKVYDLMEEDDGKGFLAEYARQIFREVVEN